MLYLSTCVGFGYGLAWRLFPGTAGLPGKSDNPEQLLQSVTFHWPTNINVVPIDYAFRPRLRGRLTLRRLTLRRNPWTSATLSFTVFVVTHVSIRTSDISRTPHGCPFADLRNAPLPRPGISNQQSVIRRRAQGRIEALQHLGDLAKLVAPRRACLLVYVFQIGTISQPHLHLVGRTNRHQKITLEFSIRPTLLAETLGNVSANRLACAPNLIGKRTLFDCWKLQRCTVHFERDTIRSLEHFEIFKRRNVSISDS